MEEKGWPDEQIDAFLSDITIKVHNSQEVIKYFSDYAKSNLNRLSPEFYEMFDKKVHPFKYVPKGYNWQFEEVTKQ